ncbi:MAG TPA: beta-glucosidase, partial [Bacilli bacterium]|nr:beta-glucosidase [Bacilli bacterium]
FPGIRGGESIANLLTGDVNPSGHLPISFPSSVGQLPMTYASLSTGRPMTEGNKEQKYISRYMDEENDALFVFGHGLSYSSFELVDIEISSLEFSKEDRIKIKTKVKNTGEYSGRTTIQLYITDKVAQLARPVKELKKWASIFLHKQEETELIFELTHEDLSYIHSNLERKTDSGKFVLHIGFSSKDLVEIGEITYID